MSPWIVEIVTKGAASSCPRLPSDSFTDMRSKPEGKRLAPRVQGCISLNVRRRARGADDKITIKYAAALLGVSEMTLRRWDNAGKFEARRHPRNNYRFYRRGELVKLRKKIDAGRAA